MADKKQKSNNSKQNIVMAAIVLAILAFVAIQCFSVLNVSLKTQTAYVATVYDTVNTQALIIRDEKQAASGDGVAVATVSNGEKVAAGGSIAMLFSSSENAQQYSNYLELERERQYYIDMVNVAVGSVMDVERLESGIVSDVNGFIRSAARGDAQGAQNYSYSLNDGFTKRSLLIGDQIDFSTVLQELNDKIEAINISACKPTGYITAEKSGYYSKYTDGCEDAFDYSLVKELDMDTFNSYLAKANSAEGTVLGSGKIIRSYVWYLCCIVDAEDVIGLKNGNNLDVYVKSANKTFSCKLVSGANVSLGDTQTLLVLSCNEMNSEISSMRVEDIEIRLKAYTGIKMSSSAVHDLDGETGVYALVSNIAKWRKADILYTGEDYVILSYNDPDVKNGIKLYDEIIIRGKDVKDGKVFA
ncbi:MAG: hypothetical protein J1E05_02360 [Eubacterium sp.]|nr:hypothetical protein [Eubacterium sp.]